MISVTISRSLDGNISGFEVKGHGEASLVCPAVSLLTLNTVNSIEALTKASFNCDHDPEGGYLKMELKSHCPEAQLLLKSMALGLHSLKETYSKDIKLKDQKEG